MGNVKSETDINQINKLLKRLNKELSIGIDVLYNILCNERENMLIKSMYGEDFFIRCSLYYNEISYDKMTGKVNYHLGQKRHAKMLKKLYKICFLYCVTMRKEHDFSNKKKQEQKCSIRSSEIKQAIRAGKTSNAMEKQIKKNSIPSLEAKLLNLEEKMNEYVACEFDTEFHEVEIAVNNLAIKETLLFESKMGYKFSKSSEKFRRYFAEGRYKNYPEMSYVESKSEVGLSFIVNKECLLYCAIYGDQLTQIPFNTEHPDYPHLSNADINYRGMVFDEYFGNLLLTGLNISLKDPYVLKDIIKYSDMRSFYG